MTSVTRRTWIAAAAGTLAARNTTVGFAFGTYGMKPVPTLEALRSIAGVGYDGVELALIEGWPADPRKLDAGARASVRDALREHGLQLPALLEALPMTGTVEKRAYNLERIRLAAGLAHELAPEHPPCLDTILGLKPADWEGGKDRMADELRAWASVAEREDFTIGVKPHADQAMDSPAKCLWMMQAVKSRRVGLVYDYSHMELGGFPLETSFMQMRPHIVHISVKDARTSGANHEYLLPGDGDTDYVSYFGLVRRSGYVGSISVEVSSMIQRKPGYDPLATARLCYRRLAPAFAAARLQRPRRRAS